MNPLRIARLTGTALVSAVALSACASDVTQPRLQQDVSTTFGHIYNTTQGLLGKPSTVSSAHSACQHLGGVKKNVGSGGWVCMITYTPSGAKAVTDKYSVSVDNTDCYVATNGLLAQTPGLTTVKGVHVVNPLYQFDGCLNPYGR